MLKEIIENIPNIKPKWEPPKGTFSKNANPSEVAKIVCKGHKSNLQKSVDCVNYFFNRCGKNCDGWNLKDKIIKELHKICN